MSYPAPILNLNFANAKQLGHPALTFSRASQGSYFDGSGIMRYANNSVPRFDHDPLTGICKGLLIEPAVTFLDTYSEQFDNAAWTKRQATITPNAAIAPDGTMTADKLVEDSTASNNHYVLSSTITIVESSVYCGSAYVEAKERQYVNIQLGNELGNAFATFNLATGSVISFGNGALSYGIIPAGNGRYMIYVTASSSGTLGSLLVSICDASGNSVYTGDGTSGLYIWGAKLYAGTGPTSYLPTTTAGVTRAADVCTVDLTKLTRNGSPLWTGTEGTIVVGFNTPASFLGDTKTIVQIDSGSDLNRVCGYFGVSGYVHASVTANGAQSFDVYKTPAIQPSSSVIFAMSFSAIGASLAVNGSSVATGIPSAFPSGLKNLQIGHKANGLEYSGATYRYVKIYNRRIADAYLPALSAL